MATSRLHSGRKQMVDAEAFGSWMSYFFPVESETGCEMKAQALVLLPLLSWSSSALGQTHLDDLRVYYTFDDADHIGSLVLDQSGSLVPLDSDAAALRFLSSGPGQVGEALFFDGQVNNVRSGVVDMRPHVAEFAVWSEGTISAWVKAPSGALLTDVLTIFSVSDSSAPSTEMRLWISNNAGPAFGIGNLVLDGRNTGSSIGALSSFGVDLLDDEWHHVAVTHEAASSVTRLYVDGVPNAVGTTGFFSALVDLDSALIGSNKDSGLRTQWHYDGGLDEFAMWPRALSAAEVEAIFDEGAAGNRLVP